MRAILAKQDARKREGKESVFYVRGRLVQNKKIDRFRQRKGISGGLDMIAKHQSKATGKSARPAYGNCTAKARYQMVRRILSAAVRPTNSFRHQTTRTRTLNATIDSPKTNHPSCLLKEKLLVTSWGVRSSVSWNQPCNPTVIRVSLNGIEAAT